MGKENVSQARPKSGAGEGSGEDADERYADLYCRQEASRVFGKDQGGGRAAATIVRKFFQAYLTGGDDGEFGQRKRPVDGDEDNHDAEFEHDLIHRPATATLASP